MRPIIIIEELKQIYNVGSESIIALNNINFEINVGEFISLIGPSGSGKSTLLNLIGGLDSPSEGNVIINEVNIRSLNQNQLAVFRRR